MGRNVKTIEYKIIYCFKDGREIAQENFDPKRDLTEEQNLKIYDAFAKVLDWGNYKIVDVTKNVNI